MFIINLLVAMIGAVTLAILSAIIYFAGLRAVDRCFRPKQFLVTSLIEKIYTPAHRSFIPIGHGKYHPKDWSLYVHINRFRERIRVDQETYHKIDRGESLAIEYVVGRLTHKCYFRTVTKV